MEINLPIEELRKRKLLVATPMYGGMCAGMFAKSVADLSALCTQYGIPLQFYFLFNESLITRARNYCCDEFMRSDASHLMFIDSDIGFNPQDVIALMALQTLDEKYEIIGGPYPKKSLHYKSKVMTEDGYKAIGKIVNQKYSGKVLSYGNSGFEFKPILAYHKTKDNGKQWVKMIARDSYGNITATHDHEIATVDDIFNPEITYMNAIDMAGRTIIRVPSNNENKMNRENKIFSTEQLAFLYGTLLGDSSIKKNGQLTCSHSEKSREYAELKADIFDMKMTNNHVTIGNKIHNTINMYGGVNIQLKELRNLLYVNGKKTVKNIVDKLDIRSFAMMYMDDGYYHKHNGVAMLCTESFTHDDCILLKNKIESLGFSCNIDTNGRIRFHKESTMKFFESISQYIIPSMEYKLGNMIECSEKFIWNLVQKMHFSIARCLDVIRLNKSHDQYDITIEDNFNFVTSGTLVHNCISWEKIKHAVDKGVADADPNVLEKFVGDFVFNPKGGQQTIALGEPCEVLEIGTGFMMISKEAMQKFAAEYPQYMYKPDHVRTEHFDGSREIMMFFQAEVDPVSKRYLSEDYWFCQKAQMANIKTWFCPWMKMQHVGTYIFSGSLADLASIGASATADPSQLGGKPKKK